MRWKDAGQPLREQPSAAPGFWQYAQPSFFARATDLATLTSWSSSFRYASGHHSAQSAWRRFPSNSPRGRSLVPFSRHSSHVGASLTRWREQRAVKVSLSSMPPLGSTHLRWNVLPQPFRRHLSGAPVVLQCAHRSFEARLTALATLTS